MPTQNCRMNRWMPFGLIHGRAPGSRWITECTPAPSERSSAASVGSQPHGPERALRRQQWIPAYIKGPDGAPLLATERVNVWRR